MQPYVADGLRAMLFHKDFRKHAEAVSLLLDHAADDPPSTLACLDLLLRWVALRQADATSNTQSLLKLLDLTRVLLTLLQDAQMELTELELLVLLPCLIEKAGHNQDRLRAMYRDVIQLTTHVAPLPRVLDLLLVCLQHSKNNRSRVEACEEVGGMLEAHGLEIATSLKVKPLPLCAQLVADRDKALRGACLGVLGRAYLELGVCVWRQLGRLTPQQQSLIEERFRALDKQVGGGGARGRVGSPVQEVDSPRYAKMCGGGVVDMITIGCEIWTHINFALYYTHVLCNLVQVYTVSVFLLPTTTAHVGCICTFCIAHCCMFRREGRRHPSSGGVSASPCNGPARLETPSMGPRSAWAAEESPPMPSLSGAGRLARPVSRGGQDTTPLPGQLRGTCVGGGGDMLVGRRLTVKAGCQLHTMLCC